MRIRCSSLGKIMPDAKSIDPALLNAETLAITKEKVKTEEDQAVLRPLMDATLSVGAKTYLKSLAKQEVYGYRPELRTKYTEKGLQVEDESIELYNSVMLCEAVKNTERRTNEYLTGEPDFLLPHKGVDIKSAWSLDTFPSLIEDAHDSDYEWQMRGYMILWSLPEWEVAYCMVDTPDELMRYEQEDMHKVGHIPENLRVTTITYEHCPIKAARIKTKCEAALKYLKETIAQIKREHQED